MGKTRFPTADEVEKSPNAAAEDATPRGGATRRFLELVADGHRPRDLLRLRGAIPEHRTGSRRESRSTVSATPRRDRRDGAPRARA